MNIINPKKTPKITKMQVLPDPICMESIEYDEHGNVRKVVFRPLEEIMKHAPQYQQMVTGETARLPFLFEFDKIND